MKYIPSILIFYKCTFSYFFIVIISYCSIFFIFKYYFNHDILLVFP